MIETETLFEINICGDCIYWSDCSEKDKFDCKYSLREKEVIKRLKKWYEKNGKPRT